MKKKSNLRKLIDKKTKYQNKYNNFSKISWIQKTMLRSKMRKIKNTIDLMTYGYIVNEDGKTFKTLMKKILIKLFKIEIKEPYTKDTGKERVRQALYFIAKNIQHNKIIVENKAKKDKNTKLFNDLNTVITKHYGKSEKELTKMLLELEKENKYLNSKLNSITQQQEYIGKQDSTFSVGANLISSDDVDGLIERLGVNQIKPVNIFYKQPDDITYMKHD
jgi:hypothetical protein